MKRSTLGRAAVPAAIVLSLGLSACSASNESASTSSTASGASGTASSSGPELSGSLNGAGATSQQAAQQAWQAGFQQSNPNVVVNYDAQGSGAGVTQFLANAVAFAGTDVPLTSDQLSQASQVCSGGSAVDMPVYISPIALAYNLPGVSDLTLSPATAANIFMGNITTWNDPAIAADNPGASLPSTPITVVHRGDKSGTTNNFTDWLHSAAPDVWTADPAEVWPLQGGEAAQGTSGVVQSITAAEGAIGYADASQVGDLGSAQVAAAGGAVGPTAEAAAATLDASEQQSDRANGDIVFTINRTPDSADAYPVILVSYLAACTSYSDPATADLVKAYATYVTSDAGQQAAAQAAGSAPISDDLRSTISSTIDMISGS